MFSGKQFGVLGVIVGANLLLSLLISTIGGSLGAQGPTGQTGPQGPQGSTGETGEDGRPVEFRVEDNVLQWRYVGETEWNELDLEISGGGSSTVNFGGSEGYFNHWVFGVNPNFQFDYPSPIEVSNSATYAQNLITNQGYLGVATLAELEDIGDSAENLGLKYVLTADIDLATWEPTYGNNVIRNEFGSFTGVFDGAGYTLSNFSFEDTTGNQTNDIGLFYELDSAEVRNLNLVDFSINTTGGGYYIGALSANVASNDSNYTILDQINLDGFEITTLNSLGNVGGLIGEIDEGIKIIRSTAANVTVASDGASNFVGGMFGYVDESSVLELYELNSQLEMTRIDSLSNNGNDRVGGLGGNVQRDSSIFAYKVNSQFVGHADENSSAFIGNVAGYSQVVLKEITVNADITRSFADSGDQVGGLFGFYGLNGLLFIDDVHVTGDIRGYYAVGGFIGHAKEGSVIKITNSSMRANLEGLEHVGGFVGELEEDGHRWMFKDNVIETVMTVVQDNPNQNDIYAEDFGGVIGYVDESNSDDTEATNQVLLDNMDVVVNLEIDVQNPEAILRRYFEFYDAGGMIGDVDQYNQIRVMNSTVEANLNFIVEDLTKFDNLELEVNDVAGVVGDMGASTLLLANVEATLDVNVLVDNLTSETTNTDLYFDLNVNSLGGAVGDSSESNLIIVEGSYDVNFVQTVSSISSPVYDYNIDVYDVAGLVGDFDDALLLGEAFETSLSFDVTIDEITLATGKTLNIEIYQIGAILGETGGSVAFLEDVTFTSTATADVQDAVDDSVMVRVDDLTKTVGRFNPFVFIG
jgi:hypothetical protein